MTQLSACSSSIAPAFSLFGAQFPAWLVCALIGVGAAIAARCVLLALKLAEFLPYPLWVCTSIGAICALLLWLTWFG
ncbi:YtcA family lipoprotein [Chitinibacter tainanensis]|uniref:YtcA family lipoprotein n=1 Tax=Chitinibacter tainanensis TaxID=230667 RepID=UPI0004049971|nr:YtcA family lipoprotein [Chitinibacter tainanensis]